GEQVPIVSTSYTPIAAGGASVNPLNSFQLKDVGINIELTPHVTVDNDVIVELLVEASAQGPDKNVAGANYPSFTRRAVVTKIRLRDGESNLLAGLLQESERKALQGVPGAIHTPILKQLFSANDQQINQTDIVMLLTPHIVRGKDYKEDDLKPMYIGSGQSLGLGGPPPLIALPEAPATPVPATGAPGAAAPGVPGGSPGVTLIPPPGSSPVPGTIAVPTPPAFGAPGTTPTPTPVPAPSPATPTP